MLSIKRVLTIFCLSPALAHADLQLANFTDQPSTSYLNLGACSTMLKKYGITQANMEPHGAPLTVPHGKLLLACSYQTVCNAIVFMNDSCQGSQAMHDYNHVGENNSIAFVQLNTTNDTITYVDDHYSHYKIYGNKGIGSSAVGSNYAMICDVNKIYPPTHPCVQPF